jgi:hypothetical protein
MRRAVSAPCPPALLDCASRAVELGRAVVAGPDDLPPRAAAALLELDVVAVPAEPLRELAHELERLELLTAIVRLHDDD